MYFVSQNVSLECVSLLLSYFLNLIIWPHVEVSSYSVGNTHPALMIDFTPMSRLITIGSKSDKIRCHVKPGAGNRYPNRLGQVLYMWYMIALGILANT